jgi:succinate dehydrogenase/fumarate reductase flavoprotein subunit
MSAGKDYDVIIIGTGIAGHCAALEAADVKARVLMVDSEDKIGGSSWLSTGILMGANTRYQRERGVTDDTPEKLFQFYMACNQWLVQPSVAKRLCYEAGLTIDWLEQRGIEYNDLTKSGGEDRPRGHCTAGGASIVNALAGRLSQYGTVDTVLKSRVDRLITKDGAVTGISVGDDIVSAAAVVMAMGGMGGDLDMIAQWHPSAFWEAATAPRYVGRPSSRGDAVRLGQQLDVQIVSGRGSRSPIWSFGGAYLPGWVVVVNALGRRFFDETSSYGMAEVIFSAQPGATGYAIFDDATKRSITTYAQVVEHLKVVLPETESIQRLWISSAIDELVSAGKVIKADTAEALAQRLGLPFDNLKGTLERYNGMVAQGSDDDYLKPSKSLRSVSTGPFYAFDMHLPLFGLTATGVRIDHNACVIHRDSRAVPGLFAAGECTGGVLGTIYVGSGNSLANTSTYGRVAGRSAAAYALHGAVPRVDWKALGAD